jgi:hypothetical protein
MLEVRGGLRRVAASDGEQPERPRHRAVAGRVADLDPARGERLQLAVQALGRAGVLQGGARLGEQRHRREPEEVARDRVEAV